MYAGLELAIELRLLPQRAVTKAAHKHYRVLMT
jgi:hypothetical protein